MTTVSHRGVQDALRFHIAFFAIAIPIALLTQGSHLGWAILLLAAAYNVGLPLMCYWRGHRQGLRLWLFLLPLSAAPPCTDYLLVQ